MILVVLTEGHLSPWIDSPQCCNKYISWLLNLPSPFLYGFHHCFFLWQKPWFSHCLSSRPCSGLQLGTSALVLPACFLFLLFPFPFPFPVPFPFLHYCPVFLMQRCADASLSVDLRALLSILNCGWWVISQLPEILVIWVAESSGVSTIRISA